MLFIAGRNEDAFNNFFISLLIFSLSLSALVYSHGNQIKDLKMSWNTQAGRISC